MDVSSGWEAAYAIHGNDRLWGEDELPFVPEIRRAIEARGATFVIDLGCGDGRNLERILGRDARCLGVDLSPTALAHAAGRIGVRGGVAFVAADAVALPIAAGTVDVVTVLDVFGQLPDPRLVLQELRRVLTDDGLMVMNAFTTSDSEFGVGTMVSPRSYVYRDTLFRFYERHELEALLNEWTVERFEEVAWTDPPHGHFRPYEHEHHSWLVWARSR